jgi:Fic family protein
MPILALSRPERQELRDLYFRADVMGREYPLARREIMTALRCLEAVHSNALEDKSIDRVFLQILLHEAGIEDRSRISPAYALAHRTMKGQQTMLEDLEHRAAAREPLSISLLREMHRTVFGGAWPDGAGKFRDSTVAITGMRHDPPPAAALEEILHQRFATINEAMNEIAAVTPETFDRVLQLSAEAHYLVAGVHPFEDGNGRIARALGDYVLLRFGMYYDVIMTDYRDNYLDSLEDCSFTDCSALHRFLEFSYLETLQRVSTFYRLAQSGARATPSGSPRPE